MRPMAAQQGLRSSSAGRVCSRRPSAACVRAVAKLDSACEAGCSTAATSRRQLLLGSAAAAALVAGAASPPLASAAQAPGDWTTPGLAAPEDPNLPKFFKTPGGVKVQRLAEGAGPAAAPGDTVLFDYTLRRADGYFVYGTIEGVSFQPRDVPVGPVSFTLGAGALIPGLEEVLVGMAPGARVRALVPPELGYASGGQGLGPQPPTFATRRQLANHSREPLLFEVQLLRVNSRK